MTEMNSLYAAQKAAAKREIERTRNKLLAFGYEVDSDSEADVACLVELDTEPEFEPEKRRRGGAREKKLPEAEATENHESLSDWA